MTEVDAQILDPGTIRYRKVGGDSYKHFVQCEPLRPKADELGKFESAEITQLFGLGEAREDIVFAKDGRKVP